MRSLYCIHINYNENMFKIAKIEIVNKQIIEQLQLLFLKFLEENNQH